jgi:rod shape determining protein RodA
VTAAGIPLQRAASPLHDKPTFRRLDLVDPYLLIATVLLMAYGLVITYSTSYEDAAAGDPAQFIIRGAIFTVLGIVTMAAVAYFDYAWFGTFAPLFYLLTLGLLVLVLVIGHNILGGQRWITIAGQKFQVSEFAKVFMIIVLAKYFADRHERIGSPLVLGGALVLLGPAFALVYRQPDLGTSLVFVGIFFGMAYLAGARPWQLASLVAVGIAGFPVIWGILAGYQKARLTAFLDPYADPQGAGWNIIQSLIAIGSGQATGKGLTAGTQSPLGYLPIAESDFVFAGLAEDLGFLGAVILFALFAVLLVATLRIGFRARDPFGTFIAAGVFSMLAFQLVVNVGMAMSLMPVTGIPLPFISHGGSSLLSICMALGLLQSVSMRRDASRLRS